MTSNKTIFFIIFLLILPLFVYFNGTVKIQLPELTNGDEPHYLVLINSLIKDLDLDLKNNYSSIYRGSSDAGGRFKYFPLGHHTLWYVNDKKYAWDEVFEENAGYWTRDAEGIPVPKQKDTVKIDVSALPEYGIHGFGLPLILFPFLYPLRNTGFVEHAALMLSMCSLILSLLLFRVILRKYTSDLQVINIASVILFFGSPVWNYGRTLFTEPFLTMLALAAYSLVLIKGRYFLAGLCIALGILMRPTFVLLAFPLAVYPILEKKYRDVVVFGICQALAVLLLLLMNYYMFGDPMKFAQHFRTANIFTGIYNVIFSWNHGLLPFLPAALIAVWYWPRFIRAHRKDALIFLSGFLLFFLHIAWWKTWWGGACFGPRYLIPILPFLMVPLVKADPKVFLRNKLFLVLCVLSFYINILGAFYNGKYWETHPVLAPVRMALKINR